MGRSVLLFSVPALLTFALGQRALAAAGRERDGYAMACMVICLACAMALLALTSLSGLRLYLRLRRMRVSKAMAALWLGLSTACVALVLLLAGLLPRTYGAAPWGPGQARVSGYLGDSHRWLENLPFRGDSRPTGPPTAGESGHRVIQDPQGESVRVNDPRAPGFVGDQGAPVSARDGTLPGGEEQGRGEGGGERGRGGERESGRVGDRETGRPGDGKSGRQGEGETGRRGEGEKPGRPQQGAGRGEDVPPVFEEPVETQPPPAAQGHERAASEAPEGHPEQEPTGAPEGDREADATAQAEAPAETPPSAEMAPTPREPANMPMPDARVLALLGALIVLLLGAYSAWRSGLLQRLAPWLGRLRGLRVKLPALPWRRSGSPRFRGAGGASHDPFAAPGLTPAERIERAYTGLLDYAQELGCPRFAHETPIEYGKRLPGPLQGVRREAVQLTRLYVMAIYGGQEMGDTQVAEARAAWERIRQVLAPRLSEG